MSKSVLIVDDEENISQALQFLMRRDGYDVRAAYDGDEALRVARAAPPDLMILDITMPKRDGYEVCETIRNDPALAGVKIVMISARGGEVSGEKGMALGADAYFAKPFSSRELTQRVRMLLSS